MRMLSVFCLLPILIVSASADEKLELATRARTILRHHCWRCHNGQSSNSGEFDVLKVKPLIEEHGLVEANKPDDSYLLQRIVKDEMPPKGIPDRVTAAEAEILKRWINAGAPEFPEASGRKFLKLDTILTALRDYLREQDRDTRPYLRFFTIHNLYNNDRVLDEDLRIYRAALSKGLNAVSTKSRIVLPQPIDQAASLPAEKRGFLNDTVYVIDIRDYGWEGRVWQAIQRVYPYGLSYGNRPEETLRRLDEDLHDLAECDIALVRADWFVSTALRPPLYHELLNIPMNARDLERTLDVNIAEDFQNPIPEEIARAGFQKSGVSGQNRLVERNNSSTGMYWKSYDFKPDTGRAKLTRFPLGPRNLLGSARHPFDGQAFEHDGGEIIWRLANGLHGYMLVDGKDNRIDEGPISVVSDALKTSGTPAIVNGLSCMACHKQGMIDLTDSIRNKSATFGEAEKHVRRLYPEPKVMSAMIADDKEQYMKVLEKCVGPFLRQGSDKEKTLEELPEPISDVARWHRLVYLDLQTIACELEVENGHELLTKIGEKRLKQLGLEDLLEKGVIGRLEWEAFDGPSLMQQVAQELRYTSKRPL